MEDNWKKDLELQGRFENYWNFKNGSTRRKQHIIIFNLCIIDIILFYYFIKCVGMLL